MKEVLAFCLCSSALFSIDAFSMGIGGQADWVLSGLNVSDQGFITEKYKNRNIFNDDLEAKLDVFHAAVLESEGVTQSELKSMKLGDSMRILYSSPPNYDGSLAESFSVGYPVTGINEEFLVDKAIRMEHQFLPNWSEAKFSYNVGLVSYGNPSHRGTVTTTIREKKDGSFAVKVEKRIRIDYQSDKFDSKKTKITLSGWGDGRLFFEYDAGRKFENRCSTKDYLEGDFYCTDGQQFTIKTASMLMEAIKLKDPELITKDWVYLFKKHLKI